MEKTLVTTIRVALALALAVPFVVMAGALPDTLYPHILGKALYFRLVVELAFAAWLYLIIRYPAYRLPRSWLLVALVAYLLVTLAASFTGVSLSRSIWSNYERMQGWVSLAHYTAFALMLASVLRSFGHWWVMLNINLLAGFVVGLLGIYELATGGRRRAHEPDLRKPDLSGELRPGQRLYRGGISRALISSAQRGDGDKQVGQPA